MNKRFCRKFLAPISVVLMSSPFVSSAKFFEFTEDQLRLDDIRKLNACDNDPNWDDDEFGVVNVEQFLNAVDASRNCDESKTMKVARILRNLGAVGAGVKVVSLWNSTSIRVLYAVFPGKGTNEKRKSEPLTFGHVGDKDFYGVVELPSDNSDKFVTEINKAMDDILNLNVDQNKNMEDIAQAGEKSVVEVSMDKDAAGSLKVAQKKMTSEIIEKSSNNNDVENFKGDINSNKSYCGYGAGMVCVGGLAALAVYMVNNLEP